MWQRCTEDFTLLVILIFISMHRLQQLARLMISWHLLTKKHVTLLTHIYYCHWLDS